MKRDFEIRVINDLKTTDVPKVELWLISPMKMVIKSYEFKTGAEFAKAWQALVTEKSEMEFKYNKQNIPNPEFPRAVKEMLAEDVAKIMKMIENNEYYPRVRNL
jgi:hypothetical protein